MAEINVDIEFQIDFYENVLRKDSKNSDVIELLASLYTKSGRIKDGLRMDQKMVALAPDNPFAMYNLACSYALNNQKEISLQTLEKAIEIGYKDVDWMIKDKDLSSVKNLPAFVDLVKKLRKKEK